MKKRFYFGIIFLVLLWIQAPVIAQIEDEYVKQNMESFKDLREDWVSTLLSSAPLPIYSLSQFQGYIFNWVPRGQKSNRNTSIDGLRWESKIGTWDAYNTYLGLYKAFRTIDMASNFEYSNQGFGFIGSIPYLSANTSHLKKLVTLSTRFSNSSFEHEGALQLNSGPLKPKWSYQLNLIYQHARNGVMPNGFKKINGIAFSLDKSLPWQQTIGFSFWWDQSAQGKMTPSIKEAFELSGQRNYNPSWGWYQGNAFYPNAKRGNVPVSAIRYEKKWSDHMSFQMNLGLAMGTQQKIQMDWTKSVDPRPDYYKYLPSYSKDSILKKQLVDWYYAHPQALQIDFDHLASINQSNIKGQSFYIINAKISKIRILKFSMGIQKYFPMDWFGQLGLHASSDVIRNYNVIDNLLGGNYFYNYNGWVDDDGSVDHFQNEIRKPDQKMITGQKWGSDYQLENTQIQFWGQLKKQAAHYEFSVSIQSENNWMNRVGFNQNGLFPLSSLGKSEILFFPAYGIKAQYLYKFSGRFYAKSILFLQTNAPSSSNLFLDPSVHANTASFILPEKQQGMDISLYFRGVQYKVNASMFWQSLHNESNKTMFYHDYFHAFVFGMMGQMQSKYNGLELGLETQLAGPFQLTATSSFGHYYISNNPLYEIKLVNDLYQVESGLLELKNLPATTTPQGAHALSIQFQPDYSSRIQLTGVLAMKRSVDYNYFRRAFTLKNQINNSAVWHDIQSEKYLPNQAVFNVFMYKQYVIDLKKQKVQVRFSANIKNLFNTLIPIIVFEQSRFDYTNRHLEKFPMKYLYDSGANYTLGIQLQIL